MFGRTRARPSLSVTGQPKLAQWSMFVGLVVSGSRYAQVGALDSQFEHSQGAVSSLISTRVVIPQ